MLSVLTPEVSACPGETVQARIRVTNAAPCPRIFRVLVTPGPSLGVLLGSISPKSIAIFLQAGQAREFTIQVPVAADSMLGMVDLRFRVTTGGYGCPFNDCAHGVTRVTVRQVVDLDVDSDNSGAVDGSPEEEDLEAASPGKWTWVNQDDSDADGQPDHFDDIINGLSDALEDVSELKIAAIDATGIPPGSVLTLSVSDVSVVEVFDGAVPGANLILGLGVASSWTFAALPATPLVLGFDGLSPGVATVSLTLMNGSQVICRDEVLITVIDLDVRWFSWDPVTMSPGSQIIEPNAHPTGAVGFQYFPDATALGGGWNRTIAAVIHTFPPVENVPIWLRAFDPDDPSDNVAPVDANGSDGGDNRGADGGLFGTTTTAQATTLPGHSYAFATFTVAVQPGDNHRVAASLKPAALARLTANVPAAGTSPSQLQVSPDDEQIPLFVGSLTRLLTTWRKLHLELAAMQRPSFDQNTWTAEWSDPRVWTSPGGGTIPDRIVIDIDDLDINNGQLSDGWLKLDPTNAASPSFRIFDSMDTVFEDSITLIVSGGLPSLGGLTSGVLRASDDDIDSQCFFNAALLNLASSFGSDLSPVTSTLPYPADGGQLLTLYAPAYILPIVLAQNPGIVPFRQNFPDFLTDSYFESYRAVRNLPISTEAYWTGLVGSGFQPETGEDGDPEPLVTKGVAPHSLGESDAGSLTGICVIFVETIHDAGGASQGEIMAHELAHTLGLPHAPGGLMHQFPQPGSTFRVDDVARLRNYREP